MARNCKGVKEKGKVKRYLVIVFVLFLLVGCASEPTPTPDLVATQIAVEEAANAAMTAELPTATSTSIPTPTETHTPQPTDTPAPPTATPSAGDTWIRAADGAEMVYVPAGEFLMGSTDDDPDASDYEKPQHTVYLDAFWIDKTEVTNAQYRKCVEAGACEEPPYWNDDTYNAPSQPVVGVSWDGAQVYAAWVGGRLPTEAEWEKAARGTDGRIYPWGNSAPDCNKANYEGCADHPLAVGSHPDGASPYGVLDMAGNVWEWVADWYDEGYYVSAPFRNPAGPDSGDFRVLRGGTFFSDPGYVRCASRGRGLPYRWFWDFGFRVCVAAQQE
jgi:formylglycine-generating enzyme required for sulfatase activity